MNQDYPITVTQRQNEYLLELQHGPQPINDLVRSMGANAENIRKMMVKLRGAELVESSKLEGARGNVKAYQLVTPYEELVEKGLIITNNGIGIPITEEEILYAAILRNAGLTGQRLTDQFIKAFPRRAKNTIIKHIVMKARRERLCR